VFRTNDGELILQYWLMKTEPSVFSLQDLQACPEQTAEWEGVRNYQARNFMRDDMKKGDAVLFYHSATKVPAIVGSAVVVREAYPDHSSWDPKSKYFDAKSSPDNPRWVMVDIRYQQEFAEPLALEELRKIPQLKEMMLLRRGMRLSIQPVTKREYEAVLRRAGAK
jgi:predicted RNA-binding protein with PUA-like domain